MSFISTKLSLSFEINKHHEGKIHIEQFPRVRHRGKPKHIIIMTEDLEEGNSHFGYWEEGRALHIANSLTLPFYLLPFYLLREGTDLEEVHLN